jgi:nicotinamidase-related amidase
VTDAVAPHRAALLLVDVQRDFLSSSLGELRTGYPDRVAHLLEVARGAGLHVVHVNSLFDADGSDWMRRYRPRGTIPCVAGTPGAVVLPEASPAEGEPVVVKQTFDSFQRTELHQLLRAAGVEVLLVAGLVTSTCVLFTATSAMQLGYLVAVVADAVADVPATHERVLRQYPFVFDSVTVDSALAWVDEALAKAPQLGAWPA